MALKLRFDLYQSSDLTSLVFSETTNLYSTSNSTGWGAPNPVVADAGTTAVLLITVPDGTQTSVDISADFPTSDDDFTLELDYSFLGGTSGDTFEDGLYKVEYQLIINTKTYTAVGSFLLYGQVKCCVSKMIAKIPDTFCSCEDKTIQKAYLSWGLLKGLEYVACCGNSDKFDNLLVVLNRLCDTEDCGC